MYDWESHYFSMRSVTVAITIGLEVLWLPHPSLAQTADQFLKGVHERFAQDEQERASWSVEKREAFAKTLQKLMADRCLDGETGTLCDAVVLCTKSPEIAGEKLPDDKELMAAREAMANVEYDSAELAKKSKDSQRQVSKRDAPGKGSM